MLGHAIGSRDGRAPRTFPFFPRCFLIILSLALFFLLSLLGAQNLYATPIRLAWDPSPSPGILGYKLHYGTASRSYSYHVDVGLSTECLIGDLLPRTIYYFAVTAYNGSAESDYSAEVVYGLPVHWLQFRYGTAHRGFNPYENILSSSTVAGLQGAWNYSTGGIWFSSPAIANGILYMGSLDKKLYALNADTGALKWSYTTGGPLDYSSPAVALAKGLVFVGSNNGKLYALNADTGAFKWSYTTGGPLVYSSPAVANGVVYVGSNDGNVYALNAVSGASLWSAFTGSEVGSSPAVVNGKVYVGSKNGVLRAYSIP
jgi:hypothetical protein